LTAEEVPVILNELTMVNVRRLALVKYLLFISLTASAPGQTNDERERRLADLERKIQQLDPSYSARVTDSFDQRLAELEQRVDKLLSVNRPAVPPAAQTPIQAISITGDYSKSEDGETRLPVAGYMEAHFNKNAGEPGVGDFHRFVLLFGHSFSDRIKFWSEFELEHSLVEGSEEKGEIALEQAYLDFLVKPWLNFRGGRDAALASWHRERKARTAVVQRRRAAVCRNADHSDNVARNGCWTHR
jgi:hypothetical protein